MKLLIADDHPLFRLGLKSALESMGLEVIAEASNGLEAEEKCMALLPEAVILDLKMPHQDGLVTLKNLREKGYAGIVAMLTTFSELAFVNEAAVMGADAYWSKDLHPSVLGQKLRDLQSGSEPRLRAPAIPRLSAREKEVLGHLAKGLSTKEIAKELQLSPETIKDHLARVYHKLNAANKTEAVLIGRNWGLV